MCCQSDTSQNRDHFTLSGVLIYKRKKITFFNTKTSMQGSNKMKMNMASSELPMPEHFLLSKNFESLNIWDWFIYSAMLSTTDYNDLPCTVNVSFKELEIYCKCSHVTIRK